MINVVVLSGNLTREPELKYLPTGTAVCEMSMAVNSKRKNQNGEYVDEVDYFDIVAFGKTAENCAEWLHKGNKVLIEGRLKQERWDKEGKTFSRVKVIVNNIEFPPKGSA